LSSNETKKLIDIRSNAQYADGFLFYYRDNKIIAHPFDPATLEFTGDPFPLTEGPSYDHNNFKADFSVSSQGTIVQSTTRSNNSVISTSLIKVDREGKPLAAPDLKGDLVEVRVSPDQKRLALTEGTEGTYDIWTYDLQRNVRSRLTFEPSVERFPAWSPDGGTIYYSAFIGGHMSIYRKDAGGIGLPTKTYETTVRSRSAHVSRDGRYLLMTLLKNNTKDDIYALPLQGDTALVPVVEDGFDKEQPSFSPEGQWVAYASDETGVYQIYVVPFRQNGSRWQISSGKEYAMSPRWRADGKELFFFNGGRIVSVTIDVKGGALVPGNPQTLFTSPFLDTPFSWDIMDDGKTFIGIRSGVASRPNDPLLVVMNWKRPEQK
jgi:Tol biopolymer transport system component